MTLRVDHIIISVKDLDIAVKEFTQKGFTVSPGGSHKGGITHNALIHFDDHTFMELISFIPGKRSVIVKFLCQTGILKYFRWIPRIRAAYRILERMMTYDEGMIDFCMESDAFPKDIHAMLAEGLPLSPPAEFHRILPNGHHIKWQICMPDFHLLPFFRSVYSPNPVVPDELTLHANGIAGIISIVIFTENLKTTAEHYQAFLGISPEVIKREFQTEVSFSTVPAGIRIISPPAKNLKEITDGTGFFAVKFK